jgi:hypothetical protein
MDACTAAAAAAAAASVSIIAAGNIQGLFGLGNSPHNPDQAV